VTNSSWEHFWFVPCDVALGSVDFTRACNYMSNMRFCDLILGRLETANFLNWYSALC